jgi:hypothetical protein
VILNIPSASNAPSPSNVSTPPTHQPHVDLSPSSLIMSLSLSPYLPSEISKASSQIDKKRKKNQKGTKPPTTLDVGSKKLANINCTGSVDEVDKTTTKNLKPKFPCSLCKGDHFLGDCPGLPKVLEMCSSMSSAPFGHASDAPSTSDIKVGKKKTIFKFPYMLCKDDHYSQLCPRMDEASFLLENIQLPTGYHKISPNPSLVDGLVNLVSSPVSLVDQVVNLTTMSLYGLPRVIRTVTHVKSVQCQLSPKMMNMSDTCRILLTPCHHDDVMMKSS